VAEADRRLGWKPALPEPALPIDPAAWFEDPG
jgi:hypothetical protein